MPVLEIGWVGTSRAWSIDQKDLARDRLVRRAWSDNTLDNQDLLAFWFDPKDQQLLEAHGSHPQTGEDDRVLLLGFDNRRDPLVVRSPAAVPYLSFYKQPIRYQSNLTFHSDGLSMKLVGLGAYCKFYFLPDASGNAGGNGLGIAQDN